MKLITEHTEHVSYIVEAKEDGTKNYVIEGIFAQAEQKNRNGRIYPKAILESAVSKYDNCLLYTSPSPRDRQKSRMPSSA